MVMPVKKKEQKTDLMGYVQKFLPFVLSMISDNKESLIRKLGGLLNLKRTIMRYGILLTVLFVAMFMFFEGMSLFINSIFPNIRPGVVDMLIGLALVAVALLYKRAWRI
jgi:hypothetical protein